jgi:MYXO-CTERM domain-containing protein
MAWNPVPTELTTAATDAVIALLAIAALVVIRRRRADDPWKVDLWSWLLVFLAGASVLGAVAHGFDLSRKTVDLLWQPLYLLLGLVVALFVVAAVRDRFGERAARRSLPFMVAAAVGFFAVTRIGSGSFLVFIAYEAVAMLAALLLYVDAALRRRVGGAGLMALGVALNLGAAAVQQSPAEAVIAGLPFDHNGLFHLVQMVALGVLTLGVLRSLSRPESPGASAT